MSSIRNDAIGGFNTFLEAQKQMPGKANMTVCLFDDKFILLHNGQDIQSVEPLTAKTYVPRGSTALYDAIGRTINAIDSRVAGYPCQKVVLVILTDGQENASKEYSGCQVKSMIKDRECKGWEVVYLSAGPDAFGDGVSIGIRPVATFSFTNSSAGMHKAYNTMCCSVSNYRSSGPTLNMNMKRIR
jgi:uncharacterized protein YegL